MDLIEVARNVLPQRSAARVEEIEKQASGVMVALYVPMDNARWMTVEGGEPAEELHVTLAYVPGIGSNEEAFDAVQDAIEGVAELCPPIDGFVGGSGRFNGSETSDYMDVFYASFDSPYVADLRQAVVHALREAGFDPSDKHGFTPHVTLKYLRPDEGTPLMRPSSMPFTVNSLSVASRAFRVDLPLTGEPVEKGQPTSSDVHVPTAGTERKRPKKKAFPAQGTTSDEGSGDGATPGPAVNPNPNARQTEGWDVPPEDNTKVRVGKDDDAEMAVQALTAILGSVLDAAEDDSSHVVVTIRKADARKQIVYGVILAPDEVDAQDDTMTEAEIEKACHLYMEKSRVVGRRHKAVISRAFPVECYIAPQELTFEGGPYGPSTVKKGSWIMGVKVNDPDDWAKVENGEYTAFSVGGRGVRD